MPDGLWGWVGPLAVTVLAGILRFWQLGLPHAIVFDETYYAKDALGLVTFGVEHEMVEKANKLLINGNTDIWTGSGSFVVHPPAGKWPIGLGELIFGATPFGWRFAAAMFGTLSVLILARTARRMTRSTLLGCLAGLLLALDGLHFVQSRIALLDIFLMFWVVAAFACIVADRDWMRTRLADKAEGITVRGFGPGIGVRPWLILAGVCLGLACATKWNGIYFMAAFGLLTFFWDAGARRAVGSPHWFGTALLRDSWPSFIWIVVVGFVVYVLSWTGWFVTDIGAFRHWAANNIDGLANLGFLTPVADALLSLWHYHVEIYTFHVGLSEGHDYQSAPWEWLLLLRPVAYYYEDPASGEMGCQVAQCSREILAQGNPAIWWAALPALVAMVLLYLRQRDWRAGAVTAAMAFGWLPWVYFSIADDRTMFFFYALPLLPFLVLALTMAAGMIIGPADAGSPRRLAGSAIVGAYALLVIVAFAYFYPVWSAEVIPYDAWHARMWLSSWI